MSSKRLQSLDALRGLIMVLMALDHANAFVAHKHTSGEYWGGRFPDYPDTLAFITRFVTHLAAPGFAFLMGVGMVLFAMSRREKGWTQQQIIRHFVVRGLILMVLQLTIINFAWSLGPNWNFDWYFGVLFALGGGMILGSLFLWMRPQCLLTLTVILLIFNEVLVPDASRWGQWYSFTEHVLMVAGGDSASRWWVNYPVIQWFELVVFGMAFGKLLLIDREKTLKWSAMVGIMFLLVFAVIRYGDGFGNVRPRSGDDWIDILNVVKYPPSLAFSLLTMGINLILLSLFRRVIRPQSNMANDMRGKTDGKNATPTEEIRPRRCSHLAVRRQKRPNSLFYVYRHILSSLIKPLTIIGRVPLMFYITHLYLYALIGKIVAPDGMSIASMYPYWLLGLAILLPMCWKYGQIKQGGYWLWRYL